MAKTRSSLIQLSGKFGDDVHVNSRRYPPHVRKAVSPGTKKDEPGLKSQYSAPGI